ncbi:hypothetical protein KKF61_02950 [Patescibacteria group bacterium]|nr:hypothetical protein [Patescibacteria group bacterium]MBU0963984.1 hypothetical protein [Patescibacteria group bacterium]
MNKKTIIILVVLVVVIGGAVSVYLWSSGGVTKKGQWEQCYEVCFDLMFTNTFKQVCDEQCAEETGYEPTAVEVKEIKDKIEGAESKEETNTNSTKNTNVVKNTNTAVNKNTAVNINTSSNVNITSVNPEGREYYCEWSWPQKIIDKDTKEVIEPCTYEWPWCNYADYSYTQAGCCTNREHTDCITLPNLSS